MTHQDIERREQDRGFTDIVATDEVTPSIARQIAGGLGGMCLLLLTGIVILLVVLW